MSFYQLCGISASVLELVFVLYYFLVISAVNHNYISDNLHYDVPFRVIMCLLIIIQHGLIICYFLRFREVKKAIMICGIIAVVVSYAGWVILNCDYTMPVHMIGFGIYVAAALMFWMVIFVFERIQYIADKSVFLYFLSAFIFCLVYSVFYVIYNDLSWFYEHIGMIFLCCTNVYFFVHHDPNPKDVFQMAPVYKPVIPEVIEYN